MPEIELGGAAFLKGGGYTKQITDFMSGAFPKTYTEAVPTQEPPPAAPLPPPPSPMPATLAPEGVTTFQAPPQPKARPARAGIKLDDSLLTSKKPSSDLDKAQRIATPGETIPIVFGKRVGNVGGVWLQPPMVKAGSKLFVGSFLYTISQGEIVASPEKHRTFVGLRNVAFLPDQTITLTHDYASAATLASAPDVCPIGGSTLYCGIDTYSFLEQLEEATVNATYTRSDAIDFYLGQRIITKGTGDTSNTVFGYTAGDVQVFNSDTGADVSAAWLAYLGYSPAVTFLRNYDSTTGGGRTVGTIVDLIALFGLEPPTDAAFNTALGLTPGSKAIYVNTISFVNTQYNALLPASTGTLLGTQTETLYSKYADPDSTPTADNSAYADITFLRVNGDIYDPPSEGSFPTTTKQLFIFYDEGVEVDLYSGGLVGGVYPTGASNQFIDLVMYLFTIYKRAAGAATAAIATPIYTGNMTDIAAFCDEYSLHYNGILDESVNLIEFASAIAPFFLLSFLSVGGQYRFEPILPLNNSDQIDVTALTPTETFNESNILPGSFGKAYKPVADRQDFIAVMLWRESNPSEVGIQRTVQVAYTTTSRDAPVQQFDLTDFCCDPNHAAMYGKYELARRKHSTHTISFQTSLVVTGLKPTDVIKLERHRISSKGDNRAEVDWYQITSISYVSDGTSEINAEHFPVDNSDIAVISDEVLNGSFRVLS
jgi:hypothetical protein